MLTSLLSLVLSLALQSPAAPPPRCDAPEFRQFDFWVGSWEVRTPDGRIAGTNEISRDLADCIVRERWHGAGGLRGESFNIWDRGTRRWHQTWVSSTGALLLLDGGFENGAMRMQGRSRDSQGEILNRITWMPRSHGTVRQLWETSKDSGKTWSSAFDGTYRKR